jgi:molybdopterin-biosynthesis enzyme MoeA-like protein
MAGVPSVFEAMVDAVLPTLRTGVKLISATVHCPFGEGKIGTPLTEIQKAHPDTIIGSYPRMADGSFSVEIVIRSKDQAALDSAREAVEAMLARLS